MPQPEDQSDIDIIAGGNDFLTPVGDGDFFTFPTPVFNSLDICSKTSQLIVDFSAMIIFDTGVGADATEWTVRLVDSDLVSLVSFAMPYVVTNDRVRIDGLIMLNTGEGQVDSGRCIFKLSDLPANGDPATEVTKFFETEDFEWPEDGIVKFQVGITDAASTITVTKANGYFDRLEAEL